ncbi:transposase family protein [Stecheria sp. CLA-KB-P133]|uniref:Transposase family protein n=1 Tax=Grylomicrobium aquisgranensis TaxID=2926318 RepID=A0AB35U4A2_9FIRM|nr:transposase family protein [Stecheria sp. CLA-KB-P133]
MNNFIKPGQIIGSGTVKYRVIYASAVDCVLCDLNKTSLSFYSIGTEALINLLNAGTYSILDDGEEYPLFDENALPPKWREAYLRNKKIVSAVKNEYGPDYLKLIGKQPKPALQKIREEADISNVSLWKIITHWMQSGCRDYSLVNERYFLPKQKDSTTVKKAGRKTDSGKSPFEFTSKDISYVDEAVQDFAKNRVMSMQDAYDRLLSHYKVLITHKDGSVYPDFPAGCKYPSYRQFAYQLHKRLSKRDIDVIKTSAREERNQKRVLLGKERGGLIYPGELCDADATPTDYFLVSKYDPEKVVGRANMYLIIDVLTGMIIGESMSFEDNSNAAVLNLLLSLKREQRDLLLNETGFTLASDDIWPTDVLPTKLRTDKGVEFTSKETMRRLKELDITAEPVPAASGSLKGSIEKEFRQFNLAHAEEFFHAGLIEKRYDSDHKEMACISVQEMRKLMVSYIIYHNTRVIESRERSREMIEKEIDASPKSLWQYYCAKNPLTHLINCNNIEYIWKLMTTAKASLTRKGIYYKGLYYTSPRDVELNVRLMSLQSTEKFDIRYDESDVSHLYYVSNNAVVQAVLNPSVSEYQDYKGMTWDEYLHLHSMDIEQKRAAKLKNNVEKTNHRERVQMILQEGSKLKPSAKNLKANRIEEKERDNNEHSAAARIEGIILDAKNTETVINTGGNEINNEQPADEKSTATSDLKVPVVTDDDSDADIKAKMMKIARGEK